MYLVEWSDRFDIEGEDETQANFASGEDAHIPSTLVPSPPLPDDAQRGLQHHSFIFCLLNGGKWS